MSERLRYQGLFKSILHPHEIPPGVKERDLHQYKALRKALHLQEPLWIFSPACGTDITLSHAFRGSHIYYMDTDQTVCDTLAQAKLPRRKTTIIHGSALDPYYQPRDIDMVVLRDATIQKEDGTVEEKSVDLLVNPLKKGGLVITSAWGNSKDASKLAVRDDMMLVGYFINKQEEAIFSTADLPQITSDLKTDTSLQGAYPNRTFVFRKISK